MNTSAALACVVAYLVVTMIDNYMSWQTCSRPIVVAPLVGLLLGDLHTGIVMGASLEAIFMGISAIGGVVAADALTGTILSVAYVILVPGEGAVDAGMTLAEADAVAVTFGPGLIGALLVGVNYAKGLALAAKKPLIGVHHIRGHIAANYLTFPDLEPPFLCLVISVKAGGQMTPFPLTQSADTLIVGSFASRTVVNK